MCCLVIDEIFPVAILVCLDSKLTISSPAITFNLITASLAFTFKFAKTCRILIAPTRATPVSGGSRTSHFAQLEST